MYSPLQGTDKGSYFEDLFVAALNVRTSTMPDWVVGAALAAPFLDSQGVDAVVHLLHTGSGKNMCVPIQIKTSAKGAENYWKKYPQYFDLGVLLIVMDTYSSVEELLESVLCALEVYQSIPETHFDEFWLALERAALVHEIEEEKKRLRKERHAVTVTGSAWIKTFISTSDV
jgi:hypothetical protein